MNYGLYLSANGARVQSQRLDVIANNLANAQTTGFKRDLALFRANHPYDREHGRTPGLPSGLDEHTGGAGLDAVVTDHRDGALEPTGNTFDVALTGPGYLKVGTGRDKYLTRDGRFTQSSTGQLVSRTSNHAVLNDLGEPIQLSETAVSVQFGPDGTITETNAAGVKNVVGRLGLVRPQSSADLRKVGHGLYAEPARTDPAGPEVRVHQGHLEASGTNPVTEMVQMIEATRAFEANTNLIKYQDESLGRLLQAVPRR